MRILVLMRGIAIILTILGSTACTHVETQYITSPLTIPERPVLPVLSADDLQCLSDDAYRRLVERNRLRREYAEEMEVIIRSTWPRDSPEK